MAAATASATASATPTATAIEAITTPPPVPADLTTPGKVGSKAAVKYFVALYGYTLNTGDTSLIRAASTETCTYCRSLASDIEEEFESGARTTGDAATVTLIRPHEGESTVDSHLWLLELAFAPNETIAADGSLDGRHGAREATVGLVAAWDEGRWRVAEYVDVVDSGSGAR